MTSPYMPGLPQTSLSRPAWADLSTRGQRVTAYRFALYDASTDRYVRDLSPEAGVELKHSTGMPARRLDLSATAAQAAGFDPVSSRVRAWAVMGGQEYPLGGRWMAASDTRQRQTGGDPVTIPMVDELHVVAQAIDAGFTARIGAGTAPALGQNAGQMTERFLARYALFGAAAGAHPPGVVPEHGYRIPVDIEPTPYRSAGSWSAGTAGTQVLQDLSVAGDYFTPWIAHGGTFRMIRAFDPAARVPAFDWDSTPAVIRDSASITTDLIDAPNRYVVVSNAGNMDRPVVGTWDVPSSAPWSVDRRGYVVPDVRSMQVLDTAQATSIAQNLGQRQQVYTRAEVSTLADPRHDGYDVILWDGALWLELGWSLTLTPGAAMRHTLRRAYT